MVQAALAHHGWGGYTSADFTLTGTVVATHLGNPHDRLTVEVDGEMWNVVMSPPDRSRRAGFNDSIVKVGDTVTMLGNRHANAGTLEMKTRRITVQGSYLRPVSQPVITAAPLIGARGLPWGVALPDRQARFLLYRPEGEAV